MNPNDIDRDLTRLLTERRRADEASAPGFHELIARDRTQRRGRGTARETREGKWAWRAAIASALCFALAAGLYVLRPQTELRPLSTATSLAEWKAPSDVLLETPGAELLGRLPVLLPLSSLALPGGDTEQATPPAAPTKVLQPKGVES